MFSANSTISLAGTVSVAGTNVFGAASGNAQVNVTGSYPITTPLVISGGNVNFTGANALTPPVMIMSGGTVTNSAPLVTGELDWSGGTIQSVVRCGGGSLSGELLELQGAQLINTGVLAYTAGQLRDGGGSVVSNAPNGVINITGQGDFMYVGSVGNVIGQAKLYNAGVLNVSAGTNTVSIYDGVINTGTIFVHSGTLSLRDGGTNEGVIAVTAADATLELAQVLDPFNSTSGSYISVAGNLVFAGDAPVNLAGTVSVEGATIFSYVDTATVNVTGYYPITTPLLISNGVANFSGVGLLNPPTFVLAGGTLSNSVPLVAGELDWISGTIAGTVQCGGGALGPGGGPGVLNLNGGQLINLGTLTWNERLTDGNGSIISNAPGATINMGTIPKYSASGGVGGTYDSPTNMMFQGPAGFYNAGQLNVAAGTNQTFIDDTVINTGTISVMSGTLMLPNGGTNAGTINVAPAATLQFCPYPVYTGPETPVCTYPVFTCTSGSSVNCAGNLVIGGGITTWIYEGYGVPEVTNQLFGCGSNVLNLAGTVNVGGVSMFGRGESYPTTVNITGPYIATNQIVVSGNVTANFNGAVAPSAAALTMSGGVLSGSAPLLVNGPLNWSGGTISGRVQFNGGTLSNTCNLQGGQLVNMGTLVWNDTTVNDGAGSAIINSPGATMNVVGSGSPGTLAKYGGSATFTNAGLLNFSAGPSPASIGDTFNNSGTVSVNSGTLLLAGVYNQTAGQTLLNGGNINNSLPLQIRGGKLSGSGSISGSVTNGGSISPGAPLGKITIGGNYVQTSSGTLNIDLGGTVAGVTFDLLAVSGKATLAGTLNVGLTNGYYPANTNTLFTFLNASPVSGGFARFSYPASEVGMQLDYAANSASIQVTNLGPSSAPVRLTSLAYADGQFTIEVGGAAGPCVIEASTNLVQWVNLFTNISPAAPFQFTDPAAGDFPRRFYRLQLAP